MSDSELFVLAGDIRFIPVQSMHEKAKNNFDYTDDDVVITHMHTRKSSKVLDQEAAGLLKAFETPKSWAEVILNFSSANKKDPQQVADEAIELLLEMKEQGFLIPFKEGEQLSKNSLFKTNDGFKNYRIKERLQFFEDSEVYKIEDDEGKKFALKILKSERDKKVSFMFNNEIEILRKLDGRVNPILIEAGSEPDFVYLIIEWCDGIGCERKAETIRNLTIRDNVIAVLDLCISILHAYAHLHAQGVLHSDIYPKNILITESGACKIIDYGISITTGGEKTKIRGGGVSFYFEPEYAAAIVNKEKSPPSTEKGEQYSIGAVLYHLISGHHHLNFSVEREKLFVQILNDEQASFSAFDLNLPSELDDIFATALAKDPAKRFESLKDFANALIAVRNSIYASPQFFISLKENSAEHFVDFISRKFGWDSLFIQKGLSLAPSCSVNYGSAGIAYMFYRMACVREEPGLLDLADVWASRAGDNTPDYDHRFYSADMGLTEKSIGKASLYHGPPGVHLTQALINKCRGENYSFTKSVNHFLAACKAGTDKIDLTLGKSGLLIGCSMLLAATKEGDDPSVVNLKLFANELLRDLWQQLDNYSAIHVKNEINYFGIAHGWAGLLYATLLWCRQSGRQLPENFIRRVEELQACMIKKDGMIKWPLSISDKTSWTGWCNGSAGHIFLWSLLYEHFNEEKYLAIARQTAVHVVQNGVNSINNLCCGLAGEAYSLSNLYHVTAEKEYLQGAQKITQKMMSQVLLPPLRSNSLYKGDIGLTVLLCEMENPGFLQMPLFEIRKI